MSARSIMAIVVVASACAEPDAIIEPGEVPGESEEADGVVEEEGRTYPAPRSIAASEVPTADPVLGTAEILDRMLPANRSRLRVVAGRVTGLALVDRAMRGTETSFATVATVEVIARYCGMAESEAPLEIMYPGGTLPSGEQSFHCGMSRDLRIGAAYLFLAIERDGGLVASCPETQVLALDDDLAAGFAGRAPASPAELEALCD